MFAVNPRRVYMKASVAHCITGARTQRQTPAPSENISKMACSWNSEEHFHQTRIDRFPINFLMQSPL